MLSESFSIGSSDRTEAAFSGVYRENWENFAHCESLRDSPGDALSYRASPFQTRSPGAFLKFPLAVRLTIGVFRALRSATRAPPLDPASF